MTLTIRQRWQQELKRLILEKALERGEFVLASGKRSNYYIDLRKLTLDPEGVSIISKLLLERARELGAEAVGGPTLGADPICGALALLSKLEGKPLQTFIVRKEAKAHGTEKLVEGPLLSGKRVVVIDDVATTGNSLLKSIRAVRELGCEVVGALVVVDREEGASELLAKEGVRLESLVKVSELLCKESC